MRSVRRRCHWYAGVAPALQLALAGTATLVPYGWPERIEGIMFARMTSEGRLLGFDRGDWAMLLGGFALVGLLALLA